LVSDSRKSQQGLPEPGSQDSLMDDIPQRV
jgi:hypothetical protein